MKIWFNTTLVSLREVIEMTKNEMDPGEFEFIITHEKANTPIRRIADAWYPEFTEKRHSTMPEGYLEWSLAFCRAHSIDAFVPFIYREELSTHASKFSDIGVRLVTAGDKATMSLLEDKPKFLARIEEIGLKGTPFRLFRNLKEFDAAWSELRDINNPEKSLCMKPARGIGGRGFKIITPGWDDNEGFLSHSNFKASLSRTRDWLAASQEPQEMMLMPLMKGAEMSTDFCCWEGKLYSAVTREKKERRLQEIRPNPAHDEMVRLIVEDFNLSGLLNMQTMEDDDGVPHILEVNSRTSGGIGKTGLSGINMPLDLFRLMSGRQVPVTLGDHRSVDVSDWPCWVEAQTGHEA